MTGYIRTEGKTDEKRKNIKLDKKNIKVRKGK